LLREAGKKMVRRKIKSNHVRARMTGEVVKFAGVEKLKSVIETGRGKL